MAYRSTDTAAHPHRRSTDWYTVLREDIPGHEGVTVAACDVGAFLTSCTRQAPMLVTVRTATTDEVVRKQQADAARRVQEEMVAVREHPRF